MESLRAGPWVFSCPRLRVHDFQAPLGTWGCLMHIPACLLWRQAQQADRAKLRQCVCSQSGALALLSRTQVKIFNDAQKWFAVEITPGSHPPASWCICVLGVCFGGWEGGGYKPKANAAWLPIPSRRQMWGSPLCWFGSALGRTCWAAG